MLRSASSASVDLVCYADVVLIHNVAACFKHPTTMHLVLSEADIPARNTQ